MVESKRKKSASSLKKNRWKYSGIDMEISDANKVVFNKYIDEIRF